VSSKGEKHKTNLPKDGKPLSHEVFSASEPKIRININNKSQNLQHHASSKENKEL
jgi:hypothetical protein